MKYHMKAIHAKIKRLLMKQYSRIKKWIQKKKIQRRLSIFAITLVILITAFFIGKNIHYSKELGTFVTSGYITSTMEEKDLRQYFSTSDFRKEIIILTNIERRKVGLNDLIENELLDKAAEAKANDLIEKNYWAHIAPDGTTPWDFIKKSGYEYEYAGENLGRGYSYPSETVNAWMISKEHKDNILSSNYKDIGVSIKNGVLTGSQTIVVVQEFGTLRDDNYHVSTSQNQSLSIDQIKSYRNDTAVVNNSWISARNRFPTDKMNQLIDSFTRQIAFSDKIISDYEERGSFSNDNFALWQAVIKMGNESSQLANELNKQ